MSFVYKWMQCAREAVQSEKSGSLELSGVGQNLMAKWSEIKGKLRGCLKSMGLQEQS